MDNDRYDILIAEIRKLNTALERLAGPAPI